MIISPLLNSLSAQAVTKNALHGFLLSALCCTAFFPCALLAGEKAGTVPAETDRRSTVEKMKALDVLFSEKFTSSIVELEYRIKPDERGLRDECTISYHCPNCDGIHQRSVLPLMRSQIPFRMQAFAIAPNVFVSSDLFLDPLWIESLQISFHGKKYPAEITGFYPGQFSIRVESKEAIPGVKALHFAPKTDAAPSSGKAGGQFVFSALRENGVFLAKSGVFAPSSLIRLPETDKPAFLRLPANTLVADRDGNALFLCMKELVPLNERYDLPVNEWPLVPVAEQMRKDAEFRQMLEENIYPVEIRLRPDKNKKEDMGYFGGVYDDEVKNMLTGTAIRLVDGKVLILSNFSVDAIARLEEISIYVKDAKGIKRVRATHEGTLRLFNAFLAVPETELPGKGIVLDTENAGRYFGSKIRELKWETFGNSIVFTDMSKFVTKFTDGFQGTGIPGEPGGHSMIFSQDGALLSLPMGYRSIAHGYSTQEQISAVLLPDLCKRIDANFAPAKGTKAHPWLGIDYQTMDRELAREKKIAALIGEGKSALLLSYIYPDSPAAKLGLKEGDILLRVTLPGRSAEQAGFSRRYDGDEIEQFPWAEYDEIPGEYYEHLPRPWGMRQSSELNNILNQIGIGEEVILSVFRNGKLEKLKIKLEAGPEDFESTEKIKIPSLGIELCALTYDVQNYFNLNKNEKVLIISSVKSGSRGAIAGLKPYELIVSVDGEAPGNAKEFANLLKQKKEISLGIKRLAKTRIVKIESLAK